MDEAEARIGTRLGNYALREIIGRGGMGVVYYAEHIYIGKPVAVKVLHKQYFDQPKARERFLQEAQAASVIDHPNIVGVTDFGEAPDGTVFLVMAHVQGQALDRVIRAEGRLPLFRTLVILSQVTRALAAAHDKGIIHHDLKPENIMLDVRRGRRELIREVSDEHGTLELVESERDFDFVTVLDFGAAKFFGDTVGTGGTGVVIGTPLYMAPETARVGIADARSDLYAVGVTMFEMLTGQVPFDGPDEVSIMVRHVRDPVPSPREVCPAAEITQDAERVVMKALAKDPEARHQSMLELHADLQRCYGLIKFRRSLHVLPPGMTAAELRKPVPLTNVKKKEKKGEAPLPASSARAPVHATPGPLLLTKRRSGRHRTLPFTPAVSESTPAPSGPARPTAPGAPARPPGKPPGGG